MTLILAAGNPELAIHVADTLLTKPDGTFYADELVKTTIVHCKNAKLLISYTGLAIIDNTRTDKWIVRRLREFRAPSKVFKEIVFFLADALNKAVRRKPALRTIGLTLVINGPGVSPDNVRQLAIAYVSNVGKPHPKRGHFMPLDAKD